MARKEHEDMLKKIKEIADKIEDDYCDCHERCPKCGKKLRPWQEWPYVHPHCQPIWMVEPYYGGTSPQMTWDSNSG